MRTEKNRKERCDECKFFRVRRWFLDAMTAGVEIPETLRETASVCVRYPGAIITASDGWCGEYAAGSE